MDEYIKREYAVDAVADVYYNTPDINLSCEKFEEAILKIQPADVAPVRHGRWEEASDGDGIVCPFCRTDFCTIIYDTEYFNYCPNCGAKMDEGIGNG